MRLSLEDKKKRNRETAKIWRSKNKDKTRAITLRKKIKREGDPKKMQEFRLRRKASVKNTIQKYPERYKEMYKKSRKRYESKPENRKKINEYNRKWKADHKEVVKVWDNNKRTKRRKAIGNFSAEEWSLLKKRYGNTCPACGLSEPTIKLSIDHIIPLIKGGSNWIENIQPLCISCNSKKHTKYIIYSPAVV